MAIQSGHTLARVIDYTAARQAAIASGHGYYGQVSASPDPFRPYKQGLQVARPDTPATHSNANAVLTNMGVSTNDTLQTMYLWVDALETAYSVSGAFAQTHGSRTFYPRNFSQDAVVIEGHVANQYEYDRLTQFVMHTQMTALRAAAATNNWFKYVDFRLFRPGHQGVANKRTFQHLPQGGAHYQMVITDMDAGHARYEFAPAFTLTCKVTNDLHDPKQGSLYQSIAAKINYTQIWGDPTTPAPDTADVTPMIPSSATNTVTGGDPFFPQNPIPGAISNPFAPPNPT